jgi:hypothetical protein
MGLILDSVRVALRTIQDRTLLDRHSEEGPKACNLRSEKDKSRHDEMKRQTCEAAFTGMVAGKSEASIAMSIP